MKSSTYSFPGLWSFISRAAGNCDVKHLGRSHQLWHCKQIQDALVLIPRLNYEEQRLLIGHAVKVRQALAVTLKGIDDAVSEVVEKFDLYDEE